MAKPASRPRTKVPKLRTSHVLHPYFGFSVRPGKTPADLLPEARVEAMCGPGARPDWLELPANEMGLWSTHPVPYLAEENEFCVGIFGGSVATWFALQSGSSLVERLERLPALRGRRVVFLNFSIPGAKQPQQLAVLTYLLSRGQHLDLAINLDGLNEVGWGASNIARGVDYTYPSLYVMHPILQLFGDDGPSVDTAMALASHLRYSARADQLRALRARLARKPMTRIAGRALARVERLLEWAAREKLELMVGGGEVQGDATTPLPMAPARADSSVQDLADHWRDCSLVFHRTCLAHGIVYAHLLQPSPYASLRRPQGEDTDGVRNELGADLARSISRLMTTYQDLLGDRAAELERHGVLFYPAQRLFEGMGDEVYADGLGHLTSLGNELLAQAMADLLSPLFQGLGEAESA